MCFVHFLQLSLFFWLSLVPLVLVVRCQSSPSLTNSPINNINFQSYQSMLNNQPKPIAISSFSRASSEELNNDKSRIWFSSSKLNGKVMFAKPKFMFKYNAASDSNHDSVDSIIHLARSKRSSSMRPYGHLVPMLPANLPLVNRSFYPPPVSQVGYPVQPPLPTMHNAADDSEQMTYESRNYPIKSYKPYQNDCQYHTLLNGDSEIILRKLLPIRLVGRTILRHCINEPNFNDPRYKVLLKGNKKSSFGSIRLQMVQ